jgi:hypothetical protein
MSISVLALDKILGVIVDNGTAQVQSSSFFGFGADHGQNLLRALVVAVEEISSRCKQGMLCFEEFTMGDFAAKMSPQHLNRIQPRTVGR